MLGLITAVKEDLGRSIAEMVYGQTLRLPGEFIMEEQGTRFCQNKFVLKLKHFDSLHPSSTTQHHKKVCTSRRIYVFSRMLKSVKSSL